MHIITCTFIPCTFITCTLHVCFSQSKLVQRQRLSGTKKEELSRAELEPQYILTNEMLFEAVEDVRDKPSWLAERDIAVGLDETLSAVDHLIMMEAAKTLVAEANAKVVALEN